MGRADVPGLVPRARTAARGERCAGRSAATSDGQLQPLVSTTLRSRDCGRTLDAPRRIVIVVGSIATGGAERVAATMANAWRERGHQVWLVSTYLGPPVVSYALHPGVAVVFLSAIMGGSRAPPGLHGLRKIRALRSLFLRIKPDVVISFLTNVNVLAILARATADL